MYDNLTANDIKKMQEEIEYRKLVVRREALEAVKEARAHGDLSENFEYKAAKQDKNRNESRIRYLEKMIKPPELYPIIPGKAKWAWEIQWRSIFLMMMRRNVINL